MAKILMKIRTSMPLFNGYLHNGIHINNENKTEFSMKTKVLRQNMFLNKDLLLPLVLLFF